MKVEISSTEAVRSFGDCLARIKYRGDSFVIIKNNEPVANLLPVESRRRGTWSEIMESLDSLPVDPGFAADLEQVNDSGEGSEIPWV